MQNNDKLFTLLEKHNCIYRNKEIKLSSGENSSIYYDIKKATGIPELFTYIIEELQKIIPEKSSIVAVSTGGIPYGAALANIYQTNFAYIRERKKKYGMKNTVEGYIDYNRPIYIIDDVCTTGKSILNAKNSLIDNKNINLVCILNRNKQEFKIISLLDVK